MTQWKRRLQTVHEEGVGEVERSYDGPGDVVRRPRLHLPLYWPRQVYVLAGSGGPSQRRHAITAGRRACPPRRRSTHKSQSPMKINTRRSKIRLTSASDHHPGSPVEKGPLNVCVCVLSGTTQLSQNQKGKTNRDFTQARDSEWQWHQLGHMQVCTALQTDNHASTPPLSFLHAGCPSCRPTNSVQALKAVVGKIYTLSS